MWSFGGNIAIWRNLRIWDLRPVEFSEKFIVTMVAAFSPELVMGSVVEWTRWMIIGTDH